MARFSPVFLAAAFAIFSYSSAPAFAQPLPQSLPTDPTGITDPAEYQAYIEALKSDDPFVIDKFVTQYPQSSGLERVLQHGIVRYVESDDSVLRYWASGENTVLQFAQRLREIAPDDMRPVAAITTLDAKRVNIGNSELVPHMCAAAQTGLKHLPGWRSPEEMTRLDSNKLRKKMAYTFHLAAGQCAFQYKDFAAARVDFARAVQLYPTRLSAVWGVTLSDLQKPIDPLGFKYCSKTIQLLKSQVANGRRSANAVARYCQAVYRREQRSEGDGRNLAEGQPAANETLSPFSLSLDRNNATKPH